MKPLVLIADGDPSLEEIFAHYLARHHIDAACVSNGLECLHRLRDRPYHALVLSMELPWGGGDGVLAAMREEPELAEIPVIVTSTLASREELSKLNSPPVIHTFPKPFSLAALLQQLHSAIDFGSHAFEHCILAPNEPLVEAGRAEVAHLRSRRAAVLPRLFRAHPRCQWGTGGNQLPRIHPSSYDSWTYEGPYECSAQMHMACQCCTTVGCGRNFVE